MNKIRHAKQRKKKPTLGIALGAGGARGFAHIGILKSLAKHNITPDYIAGTSVGAIIGAAYAAGRSPEDIASFFQNTDWKEVMDFTIPQAGIMYGEAGEKLIRELIYNKSFKQLHVPLSVVAYNLTAHKKEVFTKGNVARAVHASYSIPGIFAPVTIGKCSYIDGGIVDPTPFDVLQKKNVDVILAVDLYSPLNQNHAAMKRERELLEKLKHRFIVKELFYVKNYIFPTRWPNLIRNILIWLFDKIFYPQQILRFLSKRELPVITQVMNETINTLTNNLAWEKMHHGKIDIVIKPYFDSLDWLDLDQVEKFVKIGEQAMENKIPELKKKLGR